MVKFLGSIEERANRFLRAANETEIVLDPRLRLSDEKDLAIQQLTRRCFDVIVRLDSDAKKVYNLVFKRYEHVRQVTTEVRRDGDAGDIGVNQLANTSQNPAQSTGDSQVDAEMSRSTHDTADIPSELLVSSKAQVTPTFLSRLDPSTLDKLQPWVPPLLRICGSQPRPFDRLRLHRH